MLSNAYFLAKFRFDTAENEPTKNLQKFANFCKFLQPSVHAHRPLLPDLTSVKAAARRGGVREGGHREGVPGPSRCE